MSTKRLLLLLLCSVITTVGAQETGGLYVAGSNLDFTQAVERGLAQNPTPSRFFVLVTGDAVRGLSVVAPPELVDVRKQGTARGAVYLVCRRDIERAVFSLNDLVSEVIAVRGWPSAGSTELPAGTNYYPSEDPSNLPKSTELMRRLRSTCS